MFTVSGTNSDDAQSQIVSMMGNGGLTAEDALNILLNQAVNTPASNPPGGNLAATNTAALTSGPVLERDSIPQACSHHKSKMKI